jgi:Peptidase inhibitor I78 family
LFGGRGWCRQGEGALPSDIYCGPPTAEGLENASPPASDGLQRERGNGVSIGSGFHAGRVLVALASAAVGLVLSGSGAWADACEAKPVQALLGKPYTETLRRNAQAASDASLVQALRRGEATTAEFRGDRLDIIIDPKTNAVTRSGAAEPRRKARQPRSDENTHRQRLCENLRKQNEK